MFIVTISKKLLSKKQDEFKQTKIQSQIYLFDSIPMLKLLKKLDTKIDYHGQELASRLLYITFVIGYGIALLLGIIFKNLKFTLLFAIITAAIGFLITVPCWGFYRMHPLRFKRVVKEKKD